jgi:hypothetical protein
MWTHRLGQQLWCLQSLRQRLPLQLQRRRLLFGRLLDRRLQLR